MINILTDINSVPVTGGTIPVSVIYENAAVADIQAAHTDYDWITIEATGIYPPTGTQDHTISYNITIDPNTGLYREGSVVFRYTDASANSYTAYMFVYQGTSTVIKTSIFKDTFYEAYGNSIIYSIVHNDETVFNGKTFRNPDDPITYINVAKIARDYLYQDLGDFREYDDDVIANDGGYGMFSLVNEFGAALANYEFLYQYEGDWTGDSRYMMTEPINGHTDPRQKLMVTRYYIPDYLNIVPSSASYASSGGSFLYNVDSNTEWFVTDKPNWVSLSQLSGDSYTDVTVTVSGNTDVLNDRSGYITIETSDASARTFIEQSMAPMTLSTSKSMFALPSGATSVTFTVTSNYGFTISSTAPSPFVTINPTTGGSGSTTVTITTTNNVSSDRSDIYRLYNRDNLINLTIFQAGQEEPVTLEDYLTLDILESGNILWRKDTTGYTSSPYYSINDGDWVRIGTYSTTGYTSIAVTAGDKVRFKGHSGFRSGGYTGSGFRGGTAVFSVYGNIMSLLSSTGDFSTAKTITTSSTFSGLFVGVTGLTYARNLLLPATGLTEFCYANMFSECVNMLEGPKELPATTLSNYCYYQMYYGCHSMVPVPVISATTLAKSCCEMMFYMCKSITSSPTLSAQTLTQYCYSNMFRFCNNLNYVECLATTHSAAYCTNNWLGDVSSTGTFVRPSGVTWSPGTSGIPNGWTIIDYNLIS